MEQRQKKVKYYLDNAGEFVIENFNLAKPFANFFPGIAGKYGIPMWVFYVNRGQAIASFGTKDKDHPIMEFLPANKAWQLTPALGFRTFIKIRGKKEIFYEPFHNGFSGLNFNLQNSMKIGAGSITLEEINSTLGLGVKIKYFNIPNDSYAGLVRNVTIQNLGRKHRQIELLDGLPQIIPFGTSNLFLKKLSRTIEAWMDVENLENNVPFFRLTVDPTDRPEIMHIKEGNFYLGFQRENGRLKIIRPLINPENIFGPASDFSCPHRFLSEKKFRLPAHEITTSKTPCCFNFLDLKLSGREEKTFHAIIGYMRTLEALNQSVKRITAGDYLEKKEIENISLIEKLQDDIDTKSNLKLFDLYSRQTYLDNIIRGGYPTIFKTEDADSVFYLYSRKHGDLERDYNKFLIQPTYFSQGNGNYRDINQNRRSDLWFNPGVKDENILTFFNLLQTDGFNPLVVKGISFSIKDASTISSLLKNLVEEKSCGQLSCLLQKPFTPGDLMLFIEENQINLKVNNDEFLSILLARSVKIQEADHGEGFWTDHWTYNLDLLEGYLSVYPEKLKELFFEKKVFTFFDNSEVVRPRKEKYQLYHGCPRQLQSVTLDQAKKELISKRTDHPHVVRTQNGIGEIYKTTLINKLICLFVNKLAALDPFGTGIEMEANKPNWYDALNGLPALFGSSSCETFELKRLILLIKQLLRESKVNSIRLSEEIHDFLMQLGPILKENLEGDAADKNHVFWDKSSQAKEDYRQRTRLGVSGRENEITAEELLSILDIALLKTEIGISSALDKKKNVYCSYFINQVTGFETYKDHFIRPLKFKQIRLPFFLEGQVHALRLSDREEKAKLLYQATRKSELFDRKLKMYKVTAPLKSMPEEIGRCRIFSPGWLENESVWLHMEYKYLLEILKQGLFEEFYADFKNILIPFQDPARYGRSILENASFLVSSAFADRKLHGNGFVARLSGSTAEFLQIWLLMNLGNSPFFVNSSGELNFRFRPALKGWMFDKKGLYAFNLFSKIRVVYNNPKRKDTFGKNCSKITNISFLDKNGKPVELPSEIIPYPFAGQIRNQEISRIEVYLG